MVTVMVSSLAKAVLRIVAGFTGRMQRLVTPGADRRLTYFTSLCVSELTKVMSSDTHHLRMEILRAHSENRGLDTLYNLLYRAGKHHRVLVVGFLLVLRILVGGNAHHRIAAVGIREHHFEGFLVEVHLDTLVGKLFQQVDQTTGVEAESALALRFRHGDAGCERVFHVGAGDGKHAIVKVDIEIIEDGERVLGVYHLAHGRCRGI